MIHMIYDPSLLNGLCGCRDSNETQPGCMCNGICCANGCATRKLRTGESALIMAIRVGMLELACHLCDLGANVRTTNRRGQGVLHATVLLCFGDVMYPAYGRPYSEDSEDCSGHALEGPEVRVIESSAATCIAAPPAPELDDNAMTKCRDALALSLEHFIQQGADPYTSTLPTQAPACAQPSRCSGRKMLRVAGLENVLHLVCRAVGGDTSSWETTERILLGVTRRLLARAPRLADLQNDCGQTPLCLALSMPRVNLTLLDLLIESSSRLDLFDCSGDSDDESSSFSSMSSSDSDSHQWED